MDVAERNRELVKLGAINLSARLAAQGLMPILPLYAKSHGLSNEDAGLFLSFSYLSIFLGTILCGYFLRHSKKPLRIVFAASLLVGVSLFAFSQVSQLPYIYASAFGFWFGFGIQSTALTVFVGTLSRSHTRGKSFGFMETISAAGTISGGLIIGPMVDNFSFETMFKLLSGLCIPAIICIFFLKKPIALIERKTQPKTHRKDLFREEYLGALLAASLLVSVAFFMNRLGTSVLMKSNGISFSYIGILLATGTAISLPFPFILGMISDKSGKQLPLIICTVCLILSMAVLLLGATKLHFIMAIFFISIVAYSGGAMEAAYITDTVRKERISAILPIRNSLGWLGGMMGFFISGAIIDHFSFHTMLFTGICLTFVSLMLYSLYFWKKRSQ